MEHEDYIKREIEARAKDELDARSILDTAAAEGRDMTPEEEERFDRFVTSSDKRKETIGKLTRMAESTMQIADIRAVVEHATSQPEPVLSSAEQLRTAVLSVARGAAAAMPLEFETRALSVFSDGTSVVPVEFSDRFAFYQRTLSPYIGLATIINSNSGENLTLPRLTADMTSYSNGEGTAITPADPTLSAATLTVTKYATLTYVSQELATDNAINLMDVIARSAGRSIGLLAGTAFTAAVTGATNGGTASGTPFFDADDLITLMYGRAAPYRMVGSWVMSNGAIQKVRKFKASTSGEYLWQPSLALGTPDILLGRPVYEDPILATPASATKSVAFGDFSALVIKQLPLRVDVSRDFLFSTDQIAVKVVYRAGIALPDTAAIAVLTSYAT